MGKWIGGLAAMGVLLAMGTTQVSAQGIESIMRAREQLELTDDQIAQLETLRRGAVQERTAEMAQLEELRSQLEAGQIQRSELMAFREDLREQRQALVEQRREQIEALLTQDQLESVEQMRRRGRMGARPGGRSGGDRPRFAPRGRAEFGGPEGPRRGPSRAAPGRPGDRGAPGDG